MGGCFARAHKAGKMKGLLQSFRSMVKYLPEKMAAFQKSGGVIPEGVQKMLEKLFPALKPAYFIPEGKGTGKAGENVIQGKKKE